MGFYIRKSVNVGAFRFNLSKSGVGVSVGVKGLRIGTGPRGHYVQMGAGGLYYRATLPSPGGDRPQPAPGPTRVPGSARAGPADPTHVETLDSAAFHQMVNVSGDALIDELNDKSARFWQWKWGTGLLIGAFWFWQSAMSAHHYEAPGWVFLLWLLVSLGLVYWLYERDIVAKTTVLFYDLAPDMETAYEAWHQAWLSLAASKRLWRIDSLATGHDGRYHANAGTLIKRTPISAGRGQPPLVKSNIEVPFLNTGKVNLYFLPDRILLYAGSRVGVLSYRDLRIDGKTSRFIEDGAVPADAQVVDKAWRYSNRDGSPDRRFNGNHQIPVVLYEELIFATPRGLNEVVQASRHALLPMLQQGLAAMQRALP